MNTVSYKQYSSSIKICYALGLQNEWVDKTIRKMIPSSTSNYWKKNIRPEEYIGNELSSKIEQKLNEVKNAYHPVNEIPLKIFSAYCDFAVSIVNLLEKETIQKILRTKKDDFINLLEKHSDSISYQKVSSFLGVKLKTLYHWRTQVKFKCEHSAFLLCPKRHSNQATMEEVNTIKKWLCEDKYTHWSIHAIWALAFKQEDTSLSKQAWYYYNKLLNIRTKSNKGVKPKNESLRASKLNEIWHADITVFKTLDGVKRYIYTVMDNYSRYVHSWRIETVVSAEIRLATIKDAIKNTFGEQLPNKQIQLITDGGPENDNLTLRSFMMENQSVIKHDIALKDIVQSNSMMEAFYSTIKYRYLYLLPIHNGDELTTAFEKLIHEYHFLKPHYALGICTPDEVRNGAVIQTSFKERYQLAAQKRREVNKAISCTQKCSE